MSQVSKSCNCLTEKATGFTGTYELGGKPEHELEIFVCGRALFLRKGIAKGSHDQEDE